jgi:hypothetical protein
MLPQKHKLTDVSSQSHKGKPTKSSKKASDDHISLDKVFEDSYLVDLKMASNADLKNRIEVKNPFAFGN